MVSFSYLNAIEPTTIIFMVLLAVLIIALLVVPMFTNKKRAKQTDELHRSLKPGDLIKTIGGVVGTIVEIRQISPVDKEMVIETGVGDNKTTMVFDIQALYQVMSRSSTIVPAKEEEPVEDEQKAEEPEAKTEPAEQPAPRVVPDIMADRVENAPAAEESAATDAVTDETPAVEEKQAEAEEKPVEAAPKATTGAKKPASGSNKKSGGAKKSGK